MTIKAGDLVAVVRATLCCGNDAPVGFVFVALGVRVVSIRCRKCGAEMTGRMVQSDLVGSEGLGAGYPIEVCQKINPPGVTQCSGVPEKIVA